MTPNQKLFNDAYLGLKAQGFARSHDGMCLYRGPNGTKCAIGHCIPDDDYRERFEGEGINTCDDLAHLMRSLYGDVGLKFMINLQNAHDQAFTPEDMQKMLAAIAFEYELEIPA